MTQAAAAVVRRQIIAQAPIERAFTVFTRAIRRLQTAAAHPGRAGAPQHRPARPRLASRPRRRRRQRRMAAVPVPVRRPVHRGQLKWRRSPRAPRSTGPHRTYPSTPQTRPASTNGRRTSSTSEANTRRRAPDPFIRPVSRTSRRSWKCRCADASGRHKGHSAATPPIVQLWVA